MNLTGRLAEQQSESRPAWQKLGGGGDREVELQPVGEEEDAVDGRAAREVGELQRVLLLDKGSRPVVEHVGDGNVICDGKGQVEVGEPVTAAVDCERPHDCSRDHPLVVPREPQHVLAESVTLLDGEHRRRF